MEACVQFEEIPKLGKTRLGCLWGNCDEDQIGEDLTGHMFWRLVFSTYPVSVKFTCRVLKCRFPALICMGSHSMAVVGSSYLYF